MSNQNRSIVLSKKIPLKPRRAGAMIAACSAVAMAALPAAAGTKTFSSTGTDWLDGSNWTPAGVPATTDDVLVDSGTASMTINASPFEVQFITFSDPSNRTLTNTNTTTASTLTLDGSGSTPLISVTGTGLFQLSSATGGLGTLNLVANAPIGLNVTNAAPTLTIEGTLSEAGGARTLTKTGAGTVDLRTGAHVYTGGTVIQGGTLAIVKDLNLGPAPGAFVSNNITLDGGTLRIYSNLSTQYDLSANRGVYITANNGTISWDQSSGVPALNTVISGPGKLTKSGNRTLLVNTAQTFMGGLDIVQGRWNAQVSNSAGTGPITMKSSTGLAAQLGIGGTNVGAHVNVPHDIVLAPTGAGVNSFEVNNSTPTQNEMTLAGAISGTGGLTKGTVATTTGTLILANTGNSYSGTTNVLLGSLRLDNSGVIPDASDVSLSSGTTLDINGKTETVGSLAGAGKVVLSTVGTTGSLTAGGNGANTTYSGVMAGTGSFTKSGAGTMTMSGTSNTYTGNTTVSGGVLQVQATGSLGNDGPGNGVVLSALGQLRNMAPMSSGRSITVNGVGGSVDTQSNNVTFGGNVSGAGTLTKVGAGKLRAASVRSSGLNVSAGAVVIAPNGGEPGTSYINSLTIDPSAALDLNDNDLVVTYGTNPSTFNDVRNLVFAGYSGTPDPSKTGIISSTGQSAGNTILAVIDNALIGASDWPIGSGHTIAANSVIGKYTYFGDMDLSGDVTADDYGILDANLGTTPPPGIAWVSGDADLSGDVTPDDYGILDANFGSGVGSPLGPSVVSAVPEPGILGLLGAVGAGALMRRGRSQRSRRE